MNKKEIVIKALTAPPWRGQTLKTAVFASAMLLASSTLFAQVKIGTNPTTIDANNNLEVESSTVANKVFIKKTGKVTIADGTQGDDRVLTSDVSGEASWKTPAAQNVPVVFAVTKGSTDANQTISASVFNKIKFYNATFDKNTTFDLVNDNFTVPSGGTGYYQVNGNFTTAIISTLQGIYFYIYVNGTFLRELCVGNAPAGSGVAASGSAIVKLNAGDVVDVRVKGNGVSSAVTRAFLDVFLISK
ncbi:hypothetical protein [Dyadobacter diqingensis]|uniref:hypothetical protein n=1 Tax=Dyadobacter diqingensis TaxID=2938121 RepID=UPI0020C1B97B|nr:hypothetical protein [Dyadobacter diqingensis]